MAQQYEEESDGDDEYYEDEIDEDDNDVDDEDEDEDDDEDDGESEDEGMTGQLADIPFGELQKLKDTIGLKKYNEAVFGKKPSDNDNNSGKPDRLNLKRTKPNTETTEKKKKSEPEETSSKRHSSRPRTVVENARRRHRDPRFDNLSGKLNEDLFQKSYSFVDEMKKQEMKVVKKKFKRVRNKQEKSDLHKLLQRMEEQEKCEVQRTERRAKERQWKKDEMEAQRVSGKKAFYVKRSESKKMELVEQYKKLKKTGQLDRVMNRKRKQKASKEKKKFGNM